MWVPFMSRKELELEQVLEAPPDTQKLLGFKHALANLQPSYLTMGGTTLLQVVRILQPLGFTEIVFQSISGYSVELMNSNPKQFWTKLFKSLDITHFKMLRRHPGQEHKSRIYWFLLWELEASSIWVDLLKAKPFFFTQGSFWHRCWFAAEAYFSFDGCYSWFYSFFFQYEF